MKVLIKAEVQGCVSRHPHVMHILMIFCQFHLLWHTKIAFSQLQETTKHWLFEFQPSCTCDNLNPVSG